MRINLTQSDIQFATDVGLGRKEQNRLRRIDTGDTSPWSPDPKEDVLGATGEVACYIYFGIPLSYNDFVVPYKLYSQNKKKDLLDYEIKTIDSTRYNLVIPTYQLKDSAQIYILVYFNSSEQYCMIHGYATGEMVKSHGVVRPGLYNRPNYYQLDKSLLLPIGDLS